MSFADEYGIVMNSSRVELMRESHSVIREAIKGSRIEALDLAMPKIPSKPIYELPRPSIHRRQKRAPKVNILGEKLGAPKILNELVRMKKLDVEQERRAKVIISLIV